MKIGIVGAGTVGRATARTYLEHVEEVRVYDVVKERSTHDLREVLETDLIFVCLPTPQVQEGDSRGMIPLSCDTEIIYGFFRHVKSSILGPIPEGGWCSRNFVLRSTVPIGTTNRLAAHFGLTNLVHSPEFLTARCAVTDAHIPSRNIIGVSDLGRWSSCCYLLAKLYRERFHGVFLHVMSSDESEAVKLFLNGFFATKIAYFNEVRTLADKLGLDWDRVMEGVLSDGRIAHSHTKVPGPDGKFGFGGSCLPKDLSSLVYQLTSNELPAFVTVGAALRNETDRKRN